MSKLVSFARSAVRSSGIAGATTPMEAGGIEPPLQVCKTCVLPLPLRPRGTAPSIGRRSAAQAAAAQLAADGARREVLRVHVHVEGPRAARHPADQRRGDVVVAAGEAPAVLGPADQLDRDRAGDAAAA